MEIEDITSPGIWKKVEIRNSGIHGWGIFSLEVIQPNSVIEVSPGILINENLIKASYYMLSADGLADSDLGLDQYLIAWGENLAFLPLGWAGLFNHSDEPSAGFSRNLDNNTVRVISLREIFPGEEITVNYGKNWWKTKSYLVKK